MDCLEYPGKQQISPYQQPKEQEQSLDMKPPTLNSSFVFSGLHSNDNDNLQNQLVNKPSQRQCRKNLNLDENGARSLKDKLLNITNKQYQKKTQGNSRKLGIIKKFVKIILEAAYIFKENHYNQITKLILSEKYTQNATKYQQQSSFNVLFALACDILVILAILVIQLSIPLQISFQLSEYYLASGIIIIILLMEILLISFQPFQQKQQIQIVNMINTISILISLSTLQFILSNSIAQLIFLQYLFFSSMIKLKEKKNRLQNYVSTDISLFSLITKILLYIHQCACTWHMIGSWNSISWISESGIEESGIFLKYCHSLHWAVTNLLGIGQSNIKIITELELIFSSVIMIGSCFMISYIYNQLANIYFIPHQEKRKIKQMQFLNRNELQKINQYFQKRKVPFLIQYEVRKTIRDQELNKSKSIQLQNTLQLLNSNDQVSNWSKEKALKGCKHIMQFSRNTQKFVMNQMIYLNYGPNTQIKSEFSLFIIQNGEIEVIEYGKQIKVLKEGDYFGEYSFFSGEDVKTIFKTLKQTQVYKISQPQFCQFVQQNKQDHEKLMFIKDSLLNKNYQVIELFCLSCQSNNHLISDCHLLNYKPNTLRLIKDQVSGYQERSKIQRSTQNRKLHNQVFITLPINQRAQKKFSEKYYEQQEETSEFEEEFISGTGSSNNQHFSSNKTTEINKDGTISSTTKKELQKLSRQFRDESYDSQFEFINTPQFEQHFESLSSEKHLQFQIFDVDSVMENGIIANQQHRQFPIIVNQGKQTRMSRQLPMQPIKENESQANVLSPCNTGSIKQQSKEIDPPSLKNITKNSEDQTSLHQIKLTKNSFNSFPSRQTINRSYINKFPSKLSSISKKDLGRMQTGQKTFANPFSNVKVRFPSALELVDLSYYNNQDQEFEKMYIYQIYFPLWNVPNVIYTVNSYHRRQQYKNRQFKD